MLIFNYVLCVICTEALSELLVNSEIFKPFRKFLFKRSNKGFFKFVHNLFDCTYCMSVWVSLFVTLFSVSFLQINSFILFILSWMTIHRLASILNYVVGKMLGVFDI